MIHVFKVDRLDRGNVASETNNVLPCEPFTVPSCQSVQATGNILNRTMRNKVRLVQRG